MHTITHAWIDRLSKAVPRWQERRQLEQPPAADMTAAPAPSPSALIDWSVLDRARDGIVLIDADGKIVRVNARLEQLFGYAAPDLIGHPLERLIPLPPPGRHPVDGGRGSADPALPRRGIHQELAARHHDGRDLRIDLCLSRLHSDGQEFVLAVIRLVG